MDRTDDVQLLSIETVHFDPNSDDLIDEVTEEDSCGREIRVCAESVACSPIELFNKLVNVAEKHVYHPGDIIRGTVKLQLKRQMENVKFLKVSLKGQMQISWHESCEVNNHTRLILNLKTVDLINQSLTLWTEDDHEQLPAARTMLGYPFEILLPDSMISNVHTVFLQTGCHVTYWLEAELFEGPANAYKKQLPVYIERQLLKGDFATVPQLVWESPSYKDAECTFACSGGITAQVNLPNGIFIQDGESLITDVNVQNNSNRTVRKIKYRLKQSFQIFEGGKIRHNHLGMTVFKMKAHVTVSPGKTGHFVLRLPFPAGLEPSISKHGEGSLSHFLHIKYALEVEICTGKVCVNGPAFKFKMIIGSQSQSEDSAHIADGLHHSDNTVVLHNSDNVKDVKVNIMTRFPVYGVKQHLVYVNTSFLKPGKGITCCYTY